MVESAKHLWEYSHKALFEVELNHKAKERIKSWEDFIADTNGALKCNCMAYSPLLYWYYESPESRAKAYGYDSESEDPDGTDDVLTLIFAQWFSGITRFEIKVNRSDEDKIRSYIRRFQSKIAV